MKDMKQLKISCSPRESLCGLGSPAMSLPQSIGCSYLILFRMTRVSEMITGLNMALTK